MSRIGLDPSQVFSLTLWRARPSQKYLLATCSSPSHTLMNETTFQHDNHCDQLLTIFPKYILVRYDLIESIGSTSPYQAMVRDYLARSNVMI